MSLLMLSLLVIIAYWETSGLLAIGCLLGIYVAGTTTADPAAQGEACIDPVRSQPQRIFQGPFRARGHGRRHG